MDKKRMRGWPAVLLVVSCTASGPGLKRPVFPEPQSGVWNASVPVVDGTDDEMMPGISADGWLVYASNRDSNVDIYRRPVAGGTPERLTDHSAEDTDPVFSPNGRRIAYTSQAADVKGDIWLMDVDGSDKRAITDRTTGDSSPCWAPSGKAVYFTSAPLGQHERIERVDLEYGTRTVIVERGWDPAISADGKTLFYAALDERGRPRIYALRFSDGTTRAATDGAYPEGLPRVLGDDLLFVRFTDDSNQDRRLDGADPASLWRVSIEKGGLEQEQSPPVATPLTSGTGSELFVAGAGDWFVYTTMGAGDLEIYALPEDGQVSANATDEAILEAARSEDESALRRLGLRYLVARSPKLEGPARYELAKDLAERGEYREAVAELELARVAFGRDPRAIVSSIEIERLRLLESLDGQWWARDARQRSLVAQAVERIDRIALGESDAVDARVVGTLAESKLALGERESAAQQLEALGQAEEAPPEDRARALDRLSEVYERLGDKETLVRLCETLLRRLTAERFYARRCAERWVDNATKPIGVPSSRPSEGRNPLGLSVLAELEDIATTYADIPILAARARAELANTQSIAGYVESSRRAWQKIVDDYPSEREVLSRALINLAQGAEQRGALDVALEGFEQILSRFPDKPALRAQASRGISRIALRRAQQEESEGKYEAALSDYQRILKNDRQLAVAHRRYVYLSARLGRLAQVLAEYRAAATRNPRDKFARYGYGYALTFESSPRLSDAAREVSAALELDPRLAPAHLTLGWIRLQWERRSPRNGWAEKAVDSFRVATELIDRETEGRLYAAARLNLGNAFLELNKLDDAFLAYLERALSDVAFDEPVTELLFRERFARVALREDHLDVALDQGLVAIGLSRALPGFPRLASVSSLIGGIYFLAESYQRSLPWLRNARDDYRQKKDWDRTVPLTRTLSIAAERAGDTASSRLYAAELEAMLAEGHEPSSLSRPLFVGFEFQLWTEVAAKADDVTLGPYGFDAVLERSISKALLAREEVSAGRLETAKLLLIDRIEQLRPVYEASVIGSRAIPEWLVALNEAAVVYGRLRDWEPAVKWWSEGVTVATEAKQWLAVIQMSESLLRAWIEKPSVYSPETGRAVIFGLEAVVESGEPEESQSAARILALVDLHRMQRSRKNLQLPAGETPEARFASALGSLDQFSNAANRADRLARDYAMSDIEAALPSRPYVLQPSADTPADAVTDSNPTQEVGLARSPLERRVRAWRRQFDSSEVNTDPTALDRAIEGFLVDPTPIDSPEHARFLAQALNRLGDNVEKIWAVMEHQRLLSLQPGVARIKRGGAPNDWLQLRSSRHDADYAPESASTLVRALEGVPVKIQTLRQVLGDTAAFVQVHRVAGGWLWFAIDGDRIDRFDGEEGLVLAPEPLKVWLDSRPLETVYIDGGELLPSARSAGLGERREVLDVLSGTYLVASYDARNLARGAPLVVTDRGQQSSPENASLVHFETTCGLYGGAARAGDAQVMLGGTKPEAALDLEALASLGVQSQVALFDQVPSGPRAARLLAHAALLAGIPSTITSSRALAEARARFDASMVKERFSAAARSTLPDDVRVFGFRGMELEDRIVFAFDGLLAAARSALPVYKQAQKSDEPDLWRVAKERYTELLGYVDYLLVPEHRSLLAKSSIKLGSAIAETLPTRQLQFEQQLATAHFALGQTAAAARVREHLIEGYQAAGQSALALQEYLDLGKVRFRSNETEEARQAFLQCVRLAQKLGNPIAEAECLSRLGSVYRSEFDYKAAAKHFESAIDLYVANEHPDQVETVHYLGLLYEGSLNDYDAALASFEAALSAARRFESKKSQVAKVLLSIARIYRLRGEYEPALNNVALAREALSNSDEGQLTEILLETANIYWYRGSYRRARRAQSEALELSLRRADSFRQIQALGVGGLIALNQGRLTEAESLIRAALELSRLVARPAEEAAQLNNLGVVLQTGGRVDEAIIAFERALRIDEELGSREGRAFDLRNLGTALGRKQSYDAALDALDEALRLSRELGNRFNEVQTLFRRGEVLESLKRRDESETMFDESASLATQFALPEVEWRSLYALGRLEEARGRDSKAQDFYDRALDVAERLGRSRESNERSYSREELYEDAVRLAVRARDLDRVFELFDRRRARSRLDAFSNRTVRLADPEAQRLLREELRARDALISATRDLSRGREGAELAVRSAKREHELRRSELSDRYPRIARTFTISPVPLTQVTDRLPGNTGVLSFFIGRRRSWALLIAPTGAEVFELEVTERTLEPLLLELRENMQALAPVEDGLAVIAGLLLGPASGALSSLRHLVFVLDPAVESLPIAALPFGDGLLVDSMTTSEVPSLSTLSDLLERSPVKPKTVSAFAYGTDLPFAPLEARSIDSTPVLGGAATAEALRADRSDAWDLAVHARLDPQDPLASALEMAPGDQDDGRLQAADVFSFERVAELVSLSGCRTALGDGNAPLSLADAFISSGTRTVVATRDGVSDFAAARTMQWF